MDGEYRMAARAFAKVNLGLRVSGLRPDGFHGIVSLFQSVSWHDTLEVEGAAADGFTVEGDTRALDTTMTNLAWRALEAVRGEAARPRPLAARLVKRIPVAAGLGGGSADAAAALGLVAHLLGVERSRLTGMAGSLGSDVPFCLRGGLAVVEGRGELIRAITPVPGGYAMAIVVPPVTLLTADVYRSWDRLESPPGPELGDRHLPPSLRPYGPLANDLYPAAVSLAPLIDEWRAELSQRWGVGVAMSGSGPALFAYFSSVDEAAAALSVVPGGARATAPVVPVRAGWELVH